MVSNKALGVYQELTDSPERGLINWLESNPCCVHEDAATLGQLRRLINAPRGSLQIAMLLQ